MGGRATRTLDALIQQFLASKSLSTSKPTVDRYRYNLIPLADSDLGALPLDQISPEDLEAFLASQVQGRSLGTQRSFHAALTTLFNFAIERHYLETNPMKSIKPPGGDRKRRRIPDCFTDAQIRALLAAAGNRRDRAILLTLLDTGVRRSELLQLDIEDVDFDEGFLLIHGKGDKDRYVPIGSRATAALREYLLDHPRQGALFRNRAGKRLQVGGLRSMLDRLKKRTGLECRVHPHKFRHTFARIYLKRGDLESLRAILGHEDIKLTSEVYSSFLREGIKEKHRRCSPVDNSNWEQQTLDFSLSC